MRVHNPRITLNEQERCLVRLGLEFVLGVQRAAIENPELKAIHRSNGYSHVMAEVMRKLRSKLISSSSGKFRLNLIQVSAAKFGLQVTADHELWGEIRTSAGKRRKREPERAISALSNKLENYRRCRRRIVDKSATRTRKSLERSLDRWRAYSKWLAFLLKPSKTQTNKGNKSHGTSKARMATRVAKIDPILNALCVMLAEDGVDQRGEMGKVVQRVKRKLRYSGITIDEDLKDDEGFKELLRDAIHDTPTLLPYLKLEHDYQIVRDCARNEKFKRAVTRSLPDDDPSFEMAGGQTSLTVTESRLAGQSPVDRQMNEPVSSSIKHAVKGSGTAISGVAATASRSDIPRLGQESSRNVSCDNSNACRDDSALTATFDSTSAHGVEAVSSKAERRPSFKFSDEGVTFGIAAWLPRSGHKYKMWDGLIGQALRLMRVYPSIISGEYVNSPEPITFEQVIEKSCPGEPWKLDLDEIGYSALWIITAVGKVRSHPNQVQELLRTGLNLAWENVNRRLGHR